MRLLLTILALLAALPATAQTVRNANALPVNLHEGPGREYPAVDQLAAGEVADLGPCDEIGLWCVVSTDAKYGWVDTSALSTSPGLGATGPAAAPPMPIIPDVSISVTPLPDTGVAPGRPDARRPADPLPPEILSAIPPANVPVPVPGARAPRLLSTTEAFRNVTNGEVNLRAGPGTENAILGRLRPGEGGLVDVCDPSERWCRIDAPGIGPAWVKMTLMGLRRL